MKINALKIRQEFDKVLKQLEKSGEPIIIEKGRKPVAVLISMTEFEKRFVDYQEAEKIKKMRLEFSENAAKSSNDSLTILRKLRYGDSE